VSDANGSYRSILAVARQIAEQGPRFFTPRSPAFDRPFI
jgi:hypothetical protein